MGELKPWHIAVLVVLLILLFGSRRLPDAARGLGRSLRILKAETKGLVDEAKSGHDEQPAPPATPASGTVEQPALNPPKATPAPESPQSDRVTDR